MDNPQLVQALIDIPIPGLQMGILLVLQVLIEILITCLMDNLLLLLALIDLVHRWKTKASKNGDPVLKQALPQVKVFSLSISIFTEIMCYLFIWPDSKLDD